jgi:prepilin peptidase CpaA
MVDSHLHQVVLGSLLAVAAASDVALRRVPNALVAPLAAAGLAAQWVEGGAGAALQGVLGGAVVLLLLLLPWATGKLGGGDLKLAAAAAIWLGTPRLLDFLLLTAVAGAPVALGARLSHRVSLARSLRAAAPGGAGLGPLLEPETVPLAVAIAVGAMIALRWRLS